MVVRSNGAGDEESLDDELTDEVCGFDDDWLRGVTRGDVGLLFDDDADDDGGVAGGAVEGGWLRDMTRGDVGGGWLVVADDDLGELGNDVDDELDVDDDDDDEFVVEREGGDWVRCGATGGEDSLADVDEVSDDDEVCFCSMLGVVVVRTVAPLIRCVDDRNIIFRDNQKKSQLWPVRVPWGTSSSSNYCYQLMSFRSLTKKNYKCLEMLSYFYEQVQLTYKIGFNNQTKTNNT